MMRNFYVRLRPEPFRKGSGIGLEGLDEKGLYVALTLKEDKLMIGIPYHCRPEESPDKHIRWVDAADFEFANWVVY